jgi:hypothetical protein
LLSRLSQVFVAAAGDVSNRYTNAFLAAGVLLIIAAALTPLLRERKGAAQDVVPSPVPPSPRPKREAMVG